jgi:hypothetical protein
VLEELWSQTRAEVIKRQNLKLPVLINSNVAGPMMQNLWAGLK